jgi:AcrR family transcriptional regulator
MNLQTALRRPYTSPKRSAAARETYRRIIAATIELYGERFHDQITLDDIATRAGVTVQTVLRRFGSRDGLLEAAGEAGAAEVVAQRGEAPVGNVPGIVENLFDHYEEMGRSVLRLLAQEDRIPILGTITARGRGLHREWVRTVFAPFLGRASDAELLEAELAAVTDVYVWKLLRLDFGLDRARATAALIELINSIVGKAGRP